MSHLQPHLTQSGTVNIVISFSKTWRLSPVEADDSSWVDLSAEVPDNGWNKIKNWLCAAKMDFLSSCPRATRSHQLILPHGQRWLIPDTINYHPCLSNSPYSSGISLGFVLGFLLLGVLLWFFFSFCLYFAVIFTQWELETKPFVSGCLITSRT